jgi:hypothetical protein
VLALELLAQRGRGLARNEGPQGLEVQQLLDERCGAFRRPIEQHPFRGLCQFRGLHELIDESNLERSRAFERFSLEHEIEGGTHAEEPHGAHGAAEAWMQTELDLRQSQGEPRIIGTDPIATGQGKFETPA